MVTETKSMAVYNDDDDDDEDDREKQIENGKWKWKPTTKNERSEK